MLCNLRSNLATVLKVKKQVEMLHDQFRSRIPVFAIFVEFFVERLRIAWSAECPNHTYILFGGIHAYLWQVHVWNDWHSERWWCVLDLWLVTVWMIFILSMISGFPWFRAFDVWYVVFAAAARWIARYLASVFKFEWNMTICAYRSGILLQQKRFPWSQTRPVSTISLLPCCCAIRQAYVKLGILLGLLLHLGSTLLSLCCTQHWCCSEERSSYSGSHWVCGTFVSELCE